MGNPLVTVAVPVYMAEKYLDRCIRSLTEQSYSRLEIILVDDCSPDRCPQICDEWAAKDDRIHVIHKAKNEGQGLGRNQALDAAQGDYICFLDSDDYLMPESIEHLVAAVETEKAELAVFGLRNIAPDGTEVSQLVSPLGRRTFRGSDVQQVFLPQYIAPETGNASPFYMSSCMILYAVELLRRLKWHYVSEREIISEDVYSLLDLFAGVSSVTVVPEALYCYCCMEGSFSRGYTPGRYEKIRHFYLETLALCQRKHYSQRVLHQISKPYLGYTIATLKQEAHAAFPLKQRMGNVYRILRDETLHKVLRQNRGDRVSAKQRVLFLLIRLRCYAACFLLCSLQG